MLSVLRPAIPNATSGHAFATRFLVEDCLQTKKRRKAQSVVIPPTAAPRAVSVTSSSSAVDVNLQQRQQLEQQRHPFQEFAQNMTAFLELMKTNLIQDFLRCDKCYKVSDW